MSKFQLSFMILMGVMNLYWRYYPPSEKYLSHTMMDSKYNQSSLYHSVLTVNCVSMAALIMEFCYLCNHSMRGKEYMIYITIVAIVSVNRILVFALHPINIYYLNRISIFSIIFFWVSIFIAICLYFSNKLNKNYVKN